MENIFPLRSYKEIKIKFSIFGMICCCGMNCCGGGCCGIYTGGCCSIHTGVGGCFLKELKLTICFKYFAIILQTKN
jgi:hypothetical protein